MAEEINISQLVKKYVHGNCTKDEQQQVIAIFENPQYNVIIRSELSEIWKNEETNSELKEVNLSVELGAIHHRINLENGKWKTKKGGWGKLYKIAIKIAAVLFIPLLITTMWYYITSQTPYNGKNEWVTISSPMGSKIQTTLPDSTTVWQNGGSTIKYPRNYTKQNRHVILQGEAFFEVTSDKLHPFYVLSNDIRIKVTGTKFNVSNYKDDNYTSVVLEEGKVFIEKDKTPESKNFSYKLEPGNQFCFYNHLNQASVKQVDVEKFTSWKDGQLIFRNDPLSSVAKRLERWYNVKIELSDSTGLLSEHPFTLTIENETLQQVLNYLSLAAPIKYISKELNIENKNSLIRHKYIIMPK